MSYWFLRFSPDGRHVAGGHIRLQEDGVDLGSGLDPHYSTSDTIFYRRESDGAFMRWNRGFGNTVVRQMGFNSFDVAPDGRYMGYRTDPPRVIWWNDVPWLNWNIGAISNTRWAARQYENEALWAGTGNGINGVLIDARPCSDVRLLDDVLVWRTNGKVYGQRTHASEKEDWTIEGETQFWPVPVWINRKLYLLSHTFNRLLLYEAKVNPTWGHLVAEGITDLPDIVALDQFRVRIGWTDRGEKHERIINIAEEPIIDLRPPKEEVPVEDLSGVAIDPLPYCFGELGQRDGDHYLCVYVDSGRKRFYEIKFGNSDSWEAFAWDNQRIWMHEDRSQSEPNYNPPWDYAFTEDTWMLRPMTPRTDVIKHPNNEWIRFDPRNNKIIGRGPLHFESKISKVYLLFPFGDDVKTRAGFALDVRADGQQHLERHIFAINVGRCIFQVVKVDTDQVLFQTKFTKAGGPRLTPTVGGRDSNKWPPTIVGMTITSYEEVVNVRRSRAVCNPGPGEDWAREISWWYRLEGTTTWLQQDDPRDPRKDNDHTFRFPGAGRYEIKLRWESGQTEKKRVVIVR